MRVVVDTNELLRMAAGGPLSRLAQRWRDRRFDLLMSLSTLTELRVVLARPETQEFVPAPVGDQFLGLVEQRAIFVQPDLSAPTCRDPQDSALIATSVGGRADCLVSADSDILDDVDLRERLTLLGVHVMRAAEFLAYLETGAALS
jgi:putative PIN family toxin of toxin-antitoxin system